LYVFLSGEATLYVGDPVFEEIKESQASLREPFPPFGKSQCICKGNVLALYLLIARKPLVEVLLPVE
jgi:hypothetical protein